MYPKSTFTKIAEEAGICFVLDNKVYTVSNEGKYEKTNDFLYLGNNKYCLDPSEKLDFIEYIYIKNNRKLIEDSLEKITTSYLEKGNKTLQKEIQKLKGNFPIVDMIVNEIFPIHFGKKPNKNFKKDNKVVFKNPFDLLLNKQNSVLKSFIKNRNFIIMNGYIYKTEKVPKFVYQKNKNSLRINNSYHIYKFFDRLSNFEKQYIRMFSNKIKNISEYNKKLLDEKSGLIKEKNYFKDILGKDYYLEKDVGFLRENGGYYVLLKQEKKYVLQSKDKKNYFIFDPCTIGLKVELSNKDRITTDGRPVVMEPYHHPLIDENKPKGQICFAEEKSNYLNEILKQYNGNDAAKKIYTILLIAGKGKLLSGYTNNVRPWNELTESGFKDNLISKQELARKGYQVTN